MKICPVGAELFRAKSGQTDRQEKANGRFSQFCERALKAIIINSHTSQACVTVPDGVRDVQNCVCGSA